MTEEMKIWLAKLPEIEKAKLMFQIKKEQRRNASVSEIESKVAYDLAKETNTWITDLYDLGEPFTSGNENTNALNTQEGRVYKSNNLMNAKTMGNFLNQIDLHNKYFPETAYTFKGFTGIENKSSGKPYVEPIYSQKFIKNATEATPSEIKQYMDGLGFEQTEHFRFKNKDVEIWDARPRNVLKNDKGEIFVVDAEFTDKSLASKTSAVDTRESIIAEAKKLPIGQDVNPIMKKAKKLGITSDKELINIISPKAREFRQKTAKAMFQIKKDREEMKQTPINYEEELERHNQIQIRAAKLEAEMPPFQK